MRLQLIPRSTRSVIYPVVSLVPIGSRKLATTSQSSSQTQSGTNQTPPPPPGGSNTLITLSAVGALAGLYYYYTHGQPATDREAVRRKEEETERKVRELGDAGKAKLEGIAQRGQQDYNQAKATVQDVAGAARTRAAEARTDLRQGAQEAQAKFDGLKNTTERKLGDVRDHAEKKIEEGKEEAARQAHKAESKARNWFGWGSSK